MNRSTPGPWTVGGSLVAHKRIEIARVLHYATQADRRGRLAPDMSWDAPLIAEADANARLIASAPDLYAALARLAERVEQIELQDGSTPDTLEARALLAKIDGCPSCGGSGVQTDKDGIQSDDVCPDCNGEATK